MSLGLVADLLACPRCGSDVAVRGGQLLCANGHAFDIARQGHVNFLAGPQPAHADIREQVAARLAFLSHGHYDAVADALDDAVGEAGTILDAGAGPGWYLARLLDRRPDSRGVALDISAAATRRAAKAHDRLGAVVADTWAGLPLRSGTMDAVCCVFAPRNAPEFIRVLKPSGRLVVVTPGSDHLREAREALALVDVDPRKDARLGETLGAGFTLGAVAEMRDAMALSADEVAQVVEMGPSARHAHAEAVAMTCTLHVRVTTWLPRT